MEFSKFLAIREITPNTIALYNSLAPQPLFLTKQYFRDIYSDDVDDVTVNLFKNNYFSSATDEEIFRKISDFNHNTNGIIDTLYIVLTTSCNMACSYCSVEELYGITRTQIISEKTIKKTIDHFFEYTKKKEYYLSTNMFLWR